MSLRQLGTLLSFIFCFSCTQSSRSLRYVNWVQDFENGLHQKEQIGDFVFDLQYLPEEYLKLIENKGIESDDHLYTGFQQYQLSITLPDGKDNLLTHNCTTEEETENRLYYFSYRFQYDIHLKENGIMLPCVLYHFERSLDLANSRNFLLGFENRDSLSTEADLIIQSKQFPESRIALKILKNRTSHIL